MKLGAYSVNLSGSNLLKFQEFYQNLGSYLFGGNIEKNDPIMHNQISLKGLFQVMLENNILTFNPEWDQSDENTLGFNDVIQIQSKLPQEGVHLKKTDLGGKIPGSTTFFDPYSNEILVDQHQ